MAKALVKAQAEMGFAPKDATNPHFGSKYSDYAAVVEAVKRPLTNNGLAFAHTMSNTMDGVTVITVLMHSSGQSIQSPCFLPVAQKTPQGYGSAITYAKRYGLSAIVGLPSDEDDDGNAASAGPKPEPARGVTGLKQTLSATRPPQPPPPPPRQSPRRVQIVDVPSGPPEPPHSADDEVPATRRRQHEDISFGFARGKDVPISQLDPASLEFYRTKCQQDLRDASKAKWHDKTRKQLACVEAEIAFRGL